MTSRHTAKQPITPGWGRVAHRLKQARIDAGFPHRVDLVDELLRTGKAKLSVDRILGDLERGSRDNYSPATLSAVEAWYGLAPGEIQSLLSGEGEAAPLGVVVRRRKVSDPGYPSMPTILSRLDDDRLIEILHAIAEELGARAKHDDDPARLIGVARLDLNEDLAALDQELD
jgi:hypothetical protein